MADFKISNNGVVFGAKNLSKPRLFPVNKVKCILNNISNKMVPMKKISQGGAREVVLSSKLNSLLYYCNTGYLAFIHVIYRGARTPLYFD